MNIWEKIGIGIAVVVILVFVAWKYAGQGVTGSQASTLSNLAVYVSDDQGASDSNDGLSAGKPVRSVRRAAEIVTKLALLMPRTSTINIIGPEYVPLASDLGINQSNPIDLGNLDVVLGVGRLTGVSGITTVRVYYPPAGSNDFVALRLRSRGKITISDIWFDTLNVTLGSTGSNHFSTVIAGNKFSNTASRSGGLTLDGIVSASVRNNTFTSEQNTESLQLTVNLDDYSQEVIISGNQFNLPHAYNHRGRAIDLNGQTPAGRSVLISNNTFKTASTYEGVYDYGYYETIGVSQYGNISVIFEHNNFKYFYGVDHIVNHNESRSELKMTP